ncbi:MULTISPECIES: hypothetical protein [unclassified Nocardiopsis]|uniref:hypothetical protein n=1 Tax=unclassified Nocardiopsis TaxID=2649073 RepID=UPI00135A5D42|nr:MULTISPECIES: hypothetical protein [unclassified Nocardiopsis]
MAQENRSARRGPAAGEDPAAEVPEADAAEQRLPAADDGNGWEDPAEDSFDRAAEGDVVEQSLDVGVDEDEWR